MKKYTLKPIIPLQKLEKPYNKGTYVGIIMGIGICKMLIDLQFNNWQGIWFGLGVFTAGGLLWAWQLRETALN